MEGRQGHADEPHSPNAHALHTNTVVEYARHSVYFQDMSGGDLSRVLVIYCGGTIGMKSVSGQGYYPVPGYLTSYLADSPSFNDAQYVAQIPSLNTDSEGDLSTMAHSLGPILVMPPSIYGKRIAYQIFEYNPLKDSSNMSMEDWIQIASDIERYYAAYDAFVVLHGTDTMAYTASAVSFLLEHLGKTIIFTGSQIPFSEVRNDAKDNLLGALTLAGHYIIPEVSLLFGNRLYRGNRVSKINAVGFEAFDSPNLKPLAKLGVNIEIEWSEILRPTEIAPFRVHKTMDPNVGALRLFPGITETSVRAFLSGPIKGVVLETFGTGNAPDNRPEIMSCIGEAVRRGVVIVNITQCQKGSVSDVYSAGHALVSAGVVSGRDMTAECALTKLSYLLSLPGHGPQQIRHLMTESLRGELTIPIVHRRKGEAAAGGSEAHSWLASLFYSAVLAAAQGHRQAVDHTLRPLLMHQAASCNDVNALRDLTKHDVHIDTVDYNDQTCLHVAVTAGNREAVEWLLCHGANVHLRDAHGHTALSNALDAFKMKKDETSKKIVELLARAGACIVAPSRRLVDEVMYAAKTGDVAFLGIVKSVGVKIGETADTDGRNILHYAMSHGHEEVCQWVTSELGERAYEKLVTAKDIFGLVPSKRIAE